MSNTAPLAAKIVSYRDGAWAEGKDVGEGGDGDGHAGVLQRPPNLSTHTGLTDIRPFDQKSIIFCFICNLLLTFLKTPPLLLYALFSTIRLKVCV